ncbi:Methionine aminopeptidase 1 [candidate division SR1 bacterium Aalborg_AAW-1]|nr:Methionine aminopeptidase 1 [candidate division SR1 bacterium Aalborg_AAW-1]
MHIIKKSTQHIDKIRTSGQYLTELLHILYQQCTAGIMLKDLETTTKNYLDQHHLISAFKDFNGFPGQLCLSLNDCVVHGIPDRTLLKDGDVLKVDMGINYRGAISDSAFSIVIGGGDKNPEGQLLIDITKGALDEGMKYVQPGKFIAEYSEAVADYVYSHNHSIIKNLTGHGVGTHVHEDPNIYNYPHPSGYKIKFNPGMVVALEPITAKTSESYIEDKINGWNLYTKHGDLGAQREYTVAITDNGPEILAGIQSL